MMHPSTKRKIKGLDCHLRLLCGYWLGLFVFFVEQYSCYLLSFSLLNFLLMFAWLARTNQGTSREHKDCITVGQNLLLCSTV